MKTRQIFFPVLLLMAGRLLAQSHLGAVRGVVLDPTGAEVPLVTVRVVNQTTGEIRAGTTGSEDGRFSFAMLPPGSYRVEAEKQGYKKQTSKTDLQVSDEKWIRMELTIGDLSEEVSVTAAPSPMQTQSGTLATLIEGQQIANLPLDGRNFLELALLAPGASPAPQGSASSLRGDFALTVNGGREDAQAFLLDGVYNIDPKLNTPGVRPPVDAIREFEVVTSGYDAAFGRNAGAQINAVTQSGGNSFHGTLYGFFRTGAIDARNALAPRSEPAPDYSRHQVGGSLGGPIVANRTFFFGDYERTRLREGMTRITNVPTVAEREGNFSQSLLPPPIDPSSGQRFANDSIPGFMIHPVGLNIARLFPEPNRSTPFANFVSSPTLRDDVDHFDFKIDHRLGRAPLLTGRYSFNDRRLFEPFASMVGVPGFGTNVPRRGQNFGIGLVSPLGSTIVIETRAAFSRIGIGVFQEQSGRDLNREVGLPEVSSNPRDFGLSQISVSGFSPLGDEFTTPQESATNMVQVLNNLSWVSAAHIVEAGMDFRHVRQSAFRDVQSRGFLNFSSSYLTGNALADLLLGFPLVTGAARLDNPQRLRAAAWSVFVQDRWKLRRNVSVAAGIRYEYAAPAVDSENRATLYDVSSGTVVPVGTGAMPRGGYEADRNNWAPRLSVAWAPGNTETFVVRAGYGIYFNQGALATGEGLYFNPPFFDMTVNVPFPGVPPVTLHDPFPAAHPATLPPSATAYQRDFSTPWLEHWNVAVQQELGRSRALELAYVGSRGHNLISARDINQPAPGPALPNLRPNPLFSDITLIESRGSSDYNALQVKFQQRLYRGIALLGAYTFAKSTDDASGFFASTGDPNFPQDSRNPAAEHARSSFDIRHRFSMSFSGPLPLGYRGLWLTNHGLLSTILSDLELQGVVTLHTGNPFTVALLPEVDNSNTGRSTLGFGANDRPDLLGNPALDDPTSERWFDTTAFGLPQFGTFGNAGRNILDGPGYQNVNLGVLKNVYWGNARLQLRAEAFNLLNRPNYNLPDPFFGSPTFGRIVSAQSPRRWQFGVKLIF